MCRDAQYRDDVARQKTEGREWLRNLPLSDMIRFGWLSAPHPTRELAACLEFFSVASVAAWRRRFALVVGLPSFRTSPSYDSRPEALAAWLRQGEIEASAVECEVWNPDRFRDRLPEIRSLTRKRGPERFLPTLQRLCASCGVAVVVVRAPSGCRASGATWFPSHDRAILLLSFRFRSDDQFWFTFFHESGHLLLHGHRRLTVEGLEGTSDSEEDEANDLAARILVPEEHRREMRALRSNKEILRFAKRIGVSPGIVAGQLQHLRGDFSRYNKLKTYYEWK
ncbi:ImmA/IrrE family metallo-endopeptidase [Planctomycetota bacterium]